MSDFLWYGRLLVWVGCGALLIEAVSGTSFGYMTVVAVIFLVVGFAGFLGGLMLGDRPLAWQTALTDAPPVFGAAAEPARQPQVTMREDRYEQRMQTPAPPSVDSDARATVEEPQAVAGPATRTIETQEIGSSSPFLHLQCPQCGRTLEEGQIAAICVRCDTPHHAACWTDNRFHCATPGCDGSGNLAAPPPPEIRS